MTLTDNPFLGVVTPHASRPRVSVLLVGDDGHPARALARVPDAAEEVILVGERSALKAGFSAARGECIVVVDAAADLQASAVERFIDALRTGWASARALSTQEA